MTTNRKGAKRGKLIQVLPSGKTITLLDNKPWAELSKEKTARKQMGVPEYQLKITHI